MKISKKTITASTSAEMLFMCPKCHNEAVSDLDADVRKLADVGYHDRCVCNECGAQFVSEVKYDNKVKLIPVTDEEWDEVKGSIDSRYGLSFDRIAEIYEFLDDCGGYTDYNQKIEDVTDMFEVSPDVAESVVWDWSLNKEAEWHDTIDEEDEEPDYYPDQDDTDLYAATNTCGIPVNPEVIEEDDQINATIKPWQKNSANKDIHDDVQDAAIQWFQTSYGDPDLTLNDINEMLVVDIHEADDGRTVVEVRAELSYDGMWELAEVLNKIVAKYDKEAYFDMEEPGIMTAYLDMDGIYSSAIINVSKSAVTAAISFKDWLLKKYGLTPDDMTEEDNEIYQAEYDNLKEVTEDLDTVMAANYGGAYDIDPDAYFTRDDLTEFGEATAELISLDIGKKAEYAGAWIDNNILTADFVVDDFEYEVNIKIDMRKIRRPADLTTKYGDSVSGKFVEEYNNYMKDIEPEEFESVEELPAEEVKSAEDIDAGQKMIYQGDYYNPPEYEEPYDLSEEELFEPFEIEVNVDDVVVVDIDGQWDWETTDGLWAQPKTENYLGFQSVKVEGDVYYLECPNDDVYIVDSDSIYDQVTTLVSYRMPEEPGKYHIKARVQLVYTFSETYGFYNDGGHIDDVLTDSVEVHYDKDASEVVRFIADPIN